MTKLEACTRMVGALMGEKGMVGLGARKDGVFEAVAYTNLGIMKSCEGLSIDEAVSKLHAELCGRVQLAREAIEKTDA